jgi:hypothetical protein
MSLPLPVLDWLKSYDRTWLSGDLVAGITLAAYLLPAGLGDASLANLPPRGTLRLFVCRAGLLAVLQLAVHVHHGHFRDIPARGRVSGAKLRRDRSPARRRGHGLLVALIAFIAWLVKAGSIVNFISESDGRFCVALFSPARSCPSSLAHGHMVILALATFFSIPGDQHHFIYDWKLRAGGARAGKDFPRTNPWLLVVVGGIRSGLLRPRRRGVKLLGPVPQDCQTPSGHSLDRCNSCCPGRSRVFCSAR